MKIVGVDLGGTTFTVGLVDESGKIIKKISQRTQVEEGRDKVIEKIAKA
ncbi:MAG TPA: ROK family protein, partial [Thermotoga sp.]|nr:ROK family protein [Thermotoga sp.]